MRGFFASVTIMLLAACATQDAHQSASPGCNVEMGTASDRPEQYRLLDYVIGSYRAKCFEQSLEAALRLKEMESGKPQTPTYAYLILNYWKLDRIDEGRSIYEESLQVFGPVRPPCISISCTPGMSRPDFERKLSNREAQVIRPPKPAYPPEAIVLGIDGTCNVVFDVDIEGIPKNVVATCSHDVFKEVAEQSVRAIEFSPKIVRGTAVERRNVVYPFQFKMPKDPEQTSEE
ncbi:energy transducer TonB [Hyphomonas sp.]|uniref:energy transducer TonB n=1 Tax=Hyphomonas sp. TaxID=87 RepID=UPI001E064CA7|nr:energy transducer TonB [Hyphomonas sp.]MBU3919455.1 energy transducer TonB [Alphaproteobacteria bacterium]MBU4062664.1 energy transducer TonB [Alphaproteobacteria bacterium]MBU4164015.1 energy transducer TonB [Alphaproteobacteria bacterium]